MKNTFGNQFSVTIFGESHGEAIGVVIDGLAAGIHLDMDFINAMMDKRKAKGRISTQRKESDALHIVSGYFEGYTTGTPLTILIENTNTRSGDYTKTKNRLRPSHADYTADVKFSGYQDYRGGGSHIAQCHTIKDQPFAQEEELLEQQLRQMNTSDLAVLDETAAQAMRTQIEEAAMQGDSVGGILESAILHLPAGIGEPFFDSMESRLSHLLFSVPAVKGVEFGLGFAFCDRYGSEVNDAIIYDGKVKTRTNHNGGINGGISNGMPVLIKTVIKPTPSIYKEQDTIDKETLEAVKLTIQGRHDPAIIHRARIVVDAVLAIGILDMLMERSATMEMQK